MLQAERLPETCRVVKPIKLEVSASVGFIHKVFQYMYDSSFGGLFRTSAVDSGFDTPS
jgi:hypothetical protein